MAGGTGKIRYGEVWVDCAATDAAYEKAKADSARFGEFKEKGWTGQLSRIRGRGKPGARQEYARVQRASLERFASICGVKVAELLRREAPTVPAAGPTLSFLPISGVNFVRLGSQNHTDGAEFTFSLRLNLISDGSSFVLLGFCALYYAPDGCSCRNLDQEIIVNGAKSPTAGNYMDFETPVPVTNGIVQVTCGRRVRPPVSDQAPVDCDYGDVWVTAHILRSGAPELIERFFRFELGGNLTPIERQRDVPILSDSVLDGLRARGLLSEADYEEASRIPAVSRYHLIKFPLSVTHLHPRDGSSRKLTPEDRAFFVALHELALANRKGIAL